MPFTLTASVRTDYPGAVLLSVVGDPAVQARITRTDGTYPAQPVRNFDGTGSGIEQVTDMEAPLGRPVSYSLLGEAGNLLARSNTVTCPPLPSGRGILRSVLKPQVGWMEVEPQDETGVEWASSTSVHRVVGQDTPVVVGEIRQRHSGLMSFLCRSIAEADQMVLLLRDGTPMLLRHDPCAQGQTRDLLFYALDVRETRWQRNGWRLVLVDYQSTAFVPGETEEPPDTWTFAALRDSAANFAELANRYRNFADMALDIRKTAEGPGPATGLAASAITQTGLALTWTNPPGALGVPVVRRAAGSTPPGSPTSGTGVPVSGAGAAATTDSGLTLGTVYSYSVWTTDPATSTPAATAATLTVSTVGYGVPAGTVLTTLTTGNNPYPGVGVFTSAHVYRINGSAVFHNWRFEHRVEVHQGNVQFVNCYFAGAPGDTTTMNTALLTNLDYGTGTTTATYCTFNPQVPYNGHDGLRGDRVTIDGCEFTGTVDGMQLYGIGQSIIKNSLVHGMTYYPTGGPGGGPTHNDGIQVSSGSYWQFRNNVISGPSNSLGILITQSQGVSSDIVIDGNTFDLTGNGADVGIKDTNIPGQPIVGVTVTNNKFKHDMLKYQINATTLTFEHPAFVYNPNAWDDGASPPARGWAHKDTS